MSAAGQPATKPPSEWVRVPNTTVQKLGVSARISWRRTEFSRSSTVTGSGSTTAAVRIVYRINDVIDAASGPLPHTSPKKNPDMSRDNGNRS